MKNKKIFNIGLIGCGVVGLRRIENLMGQAGNQIGANLINEMMIVDQKVCYKKYVN